MKKLFSKKLIVVYSAIICVLVTAAILLGTFNQANAQVSLGGGTNYCIGTLSDATQIKYKNWDVCCRIPLKINGYTNAYYDTNSYNLNTFCVKGGTVLSGGNKFASVNNCTDINENITENGINMLEWLYDNIYLDYSGGEIYDAGNLLNNSDYKTERDIYINNLQNIVGNNAIKIANLSYGEIFEAQQVAIWGITNDPNDGYYNKKYGVLNETQKALAEALKQKALTQGNYNGITTLPVINKETAKIDLDKSNNSTYYLIGPFSISENSSRFQKTLKVEISENNGRYSAKEVEVVNRNGEKITGFNYDGSNIYNGEFYIKLDKETIKIDTKENSYNIKIKIDIKGYETTSQYWKNLTKEQPIVTLNRVSKSDNVPFEINLKKDQRLDLALKKSIVSINGNKLQEDRLKSIDTTPLNNGKTTALYSMKKQPVKVSVGDIVEYKISVFNEGNMAATPIEIADYLPEEVSFIPNSVRTTSNDAISYEVSPEGDVIITLGNTTSNSLSMLDPYEAGKNLAVKEIFLKCKVETDNYSRNEKILTNVAEITGYAYKEAGKTVYATGDKGSSQYINDKDSEICNWKSTNSTISEYMAAVRYIIAPITSRIRDSWREYSNGQSNWVKSGEFHNFLGQQDDDDFEKLELQQPDLALKKFIVGVNANDTALYNEDRLQNVNVNDLVKGYWNDADYTMTKGPVEVEVNDKVTYAIRIFNEGDIIAKASEITDYLPLGLKYDTNCKLYIQEQKTGTITELNLEDFEYDEETKTFIINYNGRYLNALDKENKQIDYYTIYIECIVDQNAKGIQTNIAEITEYTIKGDKIINKDKDSTSGNWEWAGLRKLNLTDRENSEWINYANGYTSWINSNFYVWDGREDDDDFEKVLVKDQYFDLALRKTISTVKDSTGNTIKQTFNNESSEEYNANITERIQQRIPTLTTASWQNFAMGVQGASTLEYYHAKDAVTVEANDIVTYRIRVYNEGTIKGQVEKIGDYLPEGLELADYTEGDGSINDIYGWHYIAGYSNETGMISANGFIGIETTVTSEMLNAINTGTDNILNGVNRETNIVDRNVDFIELFVECKVTTPKNNKYLTNVAEILQATALSDNDNDNDGNLDELDINDFDSEYGSIFQELKNNKENAIKFLKEYYLNYGENDTAGELIQTYYPGQEDDDDFDTVIRYQPSNYNMKLIKIDEITGETLNGMNFKVTGQHILPETNYITLNSGSLDEKVYTTGAGTSIEYGEKTYTNGIIEINDIPVELFGNIHRYTFEEELEEGSQYEKLKINFRILFGYDSDGNLIPKKITNLSEEQDVEIQFKDNTIIILAPNKPKGDYSLKILKVDDKNEKISGYTGFTVNYPEGNSKLLTNLGTYRQNGTWEAIDIATDKTITGLNTEEYIIQEVIAPRGYAVNNTKLHVKVETKYENNKYVTEVIEIKDENGNSVTDWVTWESDTNTNTITLHIENKLIDNDYNLQFKKVDADDPTKLLSGVSFKVEKNPEITINQQTGQGLGSISGETLVTDSTGLTNKMNTKITLETLGKQDKFIVTEINLGENKYSKIVDPLEIYVSKKMYNNEYVLSKASFDDELDVYNQKVTLENGEEVVVSADIVDNVIIITVPNKKILNPDLSLEKFITGVTTQKTQADGTKTTETKEITDRVPKFSKDITVTNGDGYVYKPLFDELKPVEVCYSDIVTYTLRIYNEGQIKEYASEITDDVPEGLEFVPYTDDATDTSINKQYRWVMYKEVTDAEIAELPAGTVIKQINGKRGTDGDTYSKCIITTDPKEADYIVTDYLSKTQGEARMSAGDTVNPNLLQPFDETAENALKNGPDYRDIKIQFKVTRKVTTKEEAEKVIINYAQISDDSDENDEEVEDIDSNPNIWIDDEDDQDREKIKVKYFDLTLVKWVSEAIITEDGVERVEPGNKYEDLVNKDDHRLIYALYPETIGDYTDLEPVVKVDIPKNKLDSTVVKFKYQIRVANQGQIDGYVKEITDYIPRGMKFLPEDNPLWKEAGDGKVVTDQLANTLLTVGGEAQTIEIVYTWINSDKNLGLIVNMAEISEDYNDTDSPDVDSTPDNQVVNEDDIDDAPVLLSVRTGDSIDPTYIIVAFSTVTLIAVGVILIKKYVL